MPFDAESHWAQLIGYIEEGLVVPVVGSGLLSVDTPEGSVSYYAHVAKRLAERLDVSSAKLPPGGELSEVACRHLARRGEMDDIYSTLSVLCKHESLPTPEALLQLASIPNFPLLVTTTFAPFLERAVNQVRFEGKPETEVLSYSLTKFDDLSGPVAQNQRPVVYHLLGKLSSLPAFAVTTEDVLEFMRAMLSVNRLPPTLYKEVEERCLLILGCRFNDWLARFFLRSWRNGRLSDRHSRPVFVADRDVAGDKSLIDFLKNFSRGTTVFPCDGPVEFVAELHERWHKLHPEPVHWTTVLRKVAINGAGKGPFVFVSYASEDRPAAERINDALCRAGVDTFFDKEGLEGGDNWNMKLREKIRDCSLFLPVISHNVLTNVPRFFRTEWELAIEIYKQLPAYFSGKYVYMVPVTIDETRQDHDCIPPDFTRPQWFRLPGGEVTPEFVERVRDLYRHAQLEKAGVR